MISKTPGENAKGCISGEAGGFPLPFAVHTLHFLGFEIKYFIFSIMFSICVGLYTRNVEMVYIMYLQV